MSIIHKATANIIRKVTEIKGRKVAKHLDKITFIPMQTQEEFLKRILKSNANTEYGKKYNFSSINSIDEYRKNVPISSYDDYLCYIDRIFTNGEQNLISSSPINHFSETSGTTGTPKRIPLSEDAAKISTEYLFLYATALLKKSSLSLSSKGIMLNESQLTVLPNNITYGAYTAKKMKDSTALCSAIYTTPTDALFPKEPMNTRYLQALYGLKDRNVSSAWCGFNCYMLEFLHFIENNSAMLIKDIEQGKIDSSIKLPNDVRKKINLELKPDPERAAELREILKQPKAGIVPKIWPNFKIMVGAGSAYFAVYTEKLKYYFGSNISFFITGYTASEGVFSVPIGLNTSESVLLPDSVFYEFLPEGSRNYSDDLVTMDKLEIGKKYEVIITNSSGFYRYKMNDIIKVRGYYNNTPTIEFVSRNTDIINLVGEKTSEFILREVINKSTEECGLNIQDYCVYPNTDTLPVRYEFLLEPSSEVTKDYDLSNLNNAVWKHLLELGDSLFETDILGKSKVYLLKKGAHQECRKQLCNTKTSGQFKPIRIINNETKRSFFYDRIDTICNYEN